MSDKIAVHLPTKDDCEKYIKFAQEMGWKWASGNQPEASLIRVRDQYEEGTSMTLGDLFYYCSMEFYIENGYRIISLEEAIGQEEQEPFEVTRDGKAVTNEEIDAELSPEFVRGEEAMKEEPKTYVKGNHKCEFTECFPNAGDFSCKFCGNENYDSEMEESPMFVIGEKVEVSSFPDFGSSYTSVAKYLGKVDSEYGHIVELEGVDYPCGYKYIRKFIRKLPQVQEGVKKFTKADIEDFANNRREDDEESDVVSAIKYFLKTHGMLEE